MCDSQNPRSGANAVPGKFHTFAFPPVATESASPTSKPTSTTAHDEITTPQKLRTRQGERETREGPRARTCQGYRLEKSTESKPISNGKAIRYKKSTTSPFSVS
jgi:hypothetical protein